LIQVLQNERNTVGKHEVLAHVLKLEEKKQKNTLKATTSSDNTNGLFGEKASSDADTKKEL